MQLGKSHHSLVGPCTGCGKKLDMVACVGSDDLPSEGDITICFRCGHIMAFDGDLKLRNLTDKEVIDVAGDPRIVAAQRARSEVLKLDAR